MTTRRRMVEEGRRRRQIGARRREMRSWHPPAEMRLCLRAVAMRGRRRPPPLWLCGGRAGRGPRCGGLGAWCGAARRAASGRSAHRSQGEVGSVLNYLLLESKSVSWQKTVSARKQCKLAENVEVLGQAHVPRTCSRAHPAEGLVLQYATCLLQSASRACAGARGLAVASLTAPTMRSPPAAAHGTSSAGFCNKQLAFESNVR